MTSCLHPIIAKWLVLMPESNRMFWVYNRPAFFWALLILILCGIPGDKIPELTFLEWLRPDKIVHVILFAVLSYLLLKGFGRQNQFQFLHIHAGKIAIIFSITYGCILEILQEYIFIHRSGDIRDAAANAVGAFIGLWIYRKYFHKNTVAGR